MAWCDFHEQRGGLFTSDYCLKKGDYIDSTTSKEYCRYDGKGCPIKEGSSSSGGCYLTTACVEHKGLPDDCMELSTLRKFRDEYMRSLPTGEAEIEEYYRTAPRIVDAINHSADPEIVYAKLYENEIKPCVELILDGKNEEAYRKYKDMVSSLKQIYC